MGDIMQKRGKGSGKKIAIIVAVVCLLLAAAGGTWFFFGRGESGQSDAVVYVNSVASITGIGNGSGVVNRFAGVVETQKEMDIQISPEKTVKEIFVEEGQEVQIGTRLFSYDTQQATDDLAKAKLELERINNSISNKYEEIAALEKEKKNASKDAQLDYTMQIQSAQMELKQSEYEKKSKEMEIGKLEDSIENAEVLSEMDGVIKSINSSGESYDPYTGESQAFMTIIAMGDYRIKGKVNEQNISSVMPGQRVIIHSRVNDEDVWYGTMGEVDMENPGNDSNGYYYYGGDSSSLSNSYPFYVELDSSEGLMLGQHVYLEMDFGQEEEKTGIWLDEYYICDVDSNPYVWADNGKGKLEKRSVVLGTYDSNLLQYEIQEGLTEEDMITYPEDVLEEGMDTASGEYGQMGYFSAEGMESEGMDEGIMDMENMDEGAMGMDEDMGMESMDEGTMGMDEDMGMETMDEGAMDSEMPGETEGEE